MFLLEFVAYIAPGSGLMFVLYRLVKKKYEVSVGQVQVRAVRSEARLEAAARAAAVAEGTAREALDSTRQALETTRVIELVDEKVTSLTDYLVSRIDGEPLARRAGRHALPGGDELPAITGGAQEGEVLP
jgi:hypothetical protein